MVEIVEVSARDGLQNEPVLVSTTDKIALINRAAGAGLRRFEVTSFVNPKRVPQMADAMAVMAGLQKNSECVWQGLLLNEKGFDRARAAGCHQVNFVVVATDTFSQRNQGTDTAGLIRQWHGVARAATAAGIRATVSIAASFGCPFEGEVTAANVLGIAEQLLESPPDELGFSDTIGCGVPAQVLALIEGARRISPDLKLKLHLHNTRNTGIANAYAALDAGVDTLDSSIGGIGGCPFAPKATGNIATEDLVYLLERSGIPTGINLDALIQTAEWLSGILGRPLPGGVTNAGGFPRAA